MKPRKSKENDLFREVVGEGRGAISGTSGKRRSFAIEEFKTESDCTAFDGMAKEPPCHFDF